jgi:pimeloyl-ACP methyl ester carboxylesterase
MDRRKFIATCLAVGSHLLGRGLLKADELEAEDPMSGHFNAKMPTLGGRQFWADEFFFDEWHIQRNSLTGHYRLLDGSNLRHTWGTFEVCRARLEQIKDERKLPPMKGAAVIVLHGLFRSAASMSHMTRFLQEKGDYTVFAVNYPTTRGTVADHAQSLDKILVSLDGITEINIVAHSLGNLVVRHYLGDHSKGNSDRPRDKRIRRMVMLGPPNRGAQMAEAFSGSKTFHYVAGASASQLAREWKELEPKLATPDFPFGILAGGRGTEKGYNPWLGQDNDMVVSVESTRLAGADDFAVLPVLHTLMMDDIRVQQYTLRFLKHGFFVSREERQPIGALELTEG